MESRRCQKSGFKGLRCARKTRTWRALAGADRGNVREKWGYGGAAGQNVRENVGFGGCKGCGAREAVNGEKIRNLNPNSRDSSQHYILKKSVS